MNPARIVAVTRLALDVLDDLDREEGHGAAEDWLRQVLQRHRHELQAIHDVALEEMKALAPRILADT